METYFGDIESVHRRLATERMQGELQTLTVAAQALVQATAGETDERVRYASGRLTDALRRAQATCEAVQQQIAAGLRTAASKTDEVVRTHPYESLGAALGVGLLIGMLVVRGSSR